MTNYEDFKKYMKQFQDEEEDTKRIREAQQRQKEEDDERQIKIAEKINWNNFLLTAQTTTMMERDKQLLTLSAGGIAFLMTFANGEQLLHFQLLYGIAAGAFLLVIILGIVIFKKNAILVEQLKNEESTEILHFKMEIMDSVVFWSFITAVSSCFISFLLKISLGG